MLHALTECLASTARQPSALRTHAAWQQKQLAALRAVTVSEAAIEAAEVSVRCAARERRKIADQTARAEATEQQNQAEREHMSDMEQLRASHERRAANLLAAYESRCAEASFLSASLRAEVQAHFAPLVAELRADAAQQHARETARAAAAAASDKEAVAAAVARHAAAIAATQAHFETERAAIERLIAAQMDVGPLRAEVLVLEAAEAAARRQRERAQRELVALQDSASVCAAARDALASQQVSQLAELRAEKEAAAARCNVLRRGAAVERAAALARLREAALREADADAAAAAAATDAARSARVAKLEAKLKAREKTRCISALRAAGVDAATDEPLEDLMSLAQAELARSRVSAACSRSEAPHMAVVGRSVSPTPRAQTAGSVALRPQTAALSLASSDGSHAVLWWRAAQ